jgi:type IV secretory pathway VirD2 relaxase
LAYANKTSPVTGAAEKITSLRNRYRHIAESIAIYEEKVSKQQSKLERMNKSSDFGSQPQDDGGDYDESMQQVFEPGMTEEDLRLEEQEIKELELKKRTLEERVTGIEKDLGGLLR